MSKPETLKTQVAALLSQESDLAARMPGFEYRPSQQRMAGLVCDSLSEGNDLVVEAPSGSGKTLAYLLPALLSGGTVIVSTATRYLQDQLARRDIPLLLEALSLSRKIAVLKGRHRYVCPYYLEKHSHDGRLGAGVRRQLLLLRQRYTGAASGEIDPLLEGLDASVREYATCSRQDCLEQHCPRYSTCPLLQHRRRAADADIIVVNHSLLFSDLVNRERADATILPVPKAVVVDEAHRLLEFAQVLVGERLSSFKLAALCREIDDVLGAVAPDQRVLIDRCRRLRGALQQLSQLEIVDEGYSVERSGDIVEQLIAGFDNLRLGLELLADGDFGLRALAIRSGHVLATLQNIRRDPGLCSFTRRERGFELNNVPVDPAVRVRELKLRYRCSWIFTSATLSAEEGNSFDQMLDLPAGSMHRLSSPLSYPDNARLYFPDIAAEPADDNYLPLLRNHVLQLVEAIGGRILFLFSSHRALQQMAELLREAGREDLLVQGEGDNPRLIECFRRQPDGLLLGTGAFWEGLDLSGAPLSAVVIDKLPFATPTDPVVKMRSRHLQQMGLDAFSRYLIPDAILKLRQGCGRLLRRATDRGVIMLADPRLHNRVYGARFLDALGPMGTVSSPREAAEFIQENR